MTTPLCDLHCKKPAEYRVTIKSKHGITPFITHLCEQHAITMVKNNIMHYASITIERI